MDRNFLRQALRIFNRNRSYTLLNLFCLSFGLTSAITGVLYALYMTGFDKDQVNYDRIFEVESLVTYFNGASFPKEPLSASVDELIRRNVPEIEKIARVSDSQALISSGDNKFSENGIYADPGFFDIFSYPFISRRTAGTVSDMNGIIITERLAKKLFHTSDCIDSILLLEEGKIQRVFNIRAVIRDIPAQSALRFDYVIPFERFLSDNSGALEPGASACRVWVLAGSRTELRDINSKLKDLIRDQEETLNQELFLFPLGEKNLYSYSGGKRVWREMQTVVTVTAVSLAILVIACFNFINLSIAQNLKRYREVGVKKAFGAGKNDIILQFMGETFLLVLTGMIIAVVLTRIFTGAFNTFFNGDIHPDFLDPGVILSFIIILLATVFISGALPARYLSAPDPVAILRERKITGHSFSILRRCLIIFQFVIPVLLIIFLLVLRNQEIFMNSYDLGVDRENLCLVKNSERSGLKDESLRNDLLAIPGVKAVSFTNCVPTRGARVTNEVTWPGKDETKKLHFWTICTDYDYNRTVNINMISGRYFDRSFLADSASYVINDIAAEVMSLGDPVGKQITVNGKKGTIAGVFTGFHTVDLRGPFTPTVISVGSDEKTDILIKFSGVAFSELRDKADEVFRKYDPEIQFMPVLFSDLPDITGLKRISILLELAFLIALLLACLGLFGLASFTAEWRSREIGIRKVNGATSLSVLILLLKNYVFLQMISFLFALPLAFLAGRLYLEGFYFHAPIAWWAFIAGPALALAVAVAAVLLKSWRLASCNPVDSLRYD